MRLLQACELKKIGIKNMQAKSKNQISTYHIYLMVKIGHITSQKATGETALLYSNHWKTWPAFGMNYPDAKFSFSFLSETGSLLYLKRMRPTTYKTLID